MIDLKDITLQIETKVLLEKAFLHISDGQKVGLVGHNGCGKSTLLKLLQEDVESERERLYFPKEDRISFVEQEISDPSISVLDYVLSKDTELIRLRQQLLTVPDMEKPDIHERLRLLGSEGAEGRIARILSGLGFKNDDLKRPVSDFSGGWRMRLSLAGALFKPSDVLLLDEPTNHLDLEASLWLEDHLKKYGGTLLIVSHDRNILNQVCHYIVSFEQKKLVFYNGNYDTFLKTKALRQQVLTRQAQKLAQKRAHLQSFIDRFRYKASKAKQAQSRIKMLEKMEESPEIYLETPDHFQFPDPGRLLPPLIKVENGSVGYGGEPVLRRLNFSIGENDRIALLGANGNGKSTLAKLLCGKLSLQEGEIVRSQQLRIGYFAQHQSEELPLEETPVAYLKGLMRDQNETQIRSFLAGFGLEGTKATTLIKNLSGGEKARLLFAVISIDKPALLILDEPTNHLDIQGREALLDALNGYRGSVVLITHDLHMIEAMADELWLINQHRCQPFLGDMEDYKKFLLGPDPSSSTLKDKKKNEQKQAVLKQSDKRKIKAKLLSLEQEIEKKQREKKEIEDGFQSLRSGEEIVSMTKRLKILTEEIEKLEESWLTVSEEME